MLCSCADQIEQLGSDMAKLRSRVTLVEDALPLKADKAALEAAIQEFRDEIKKLNIEESLS